MKYTLEQQEDDYGVTIVLRFPKESKVTESMMDVIGDLAKTPPPTCVDYSDVITAWNDTSGVVIRSAMEVNSATKDLCEFFANNDVGETEFVAAIENYGKARRIPNSKAPSRSLFNFFQHWRKYKPGSYTPENYKPETFGEKPKSKQVKDMKCNVSGCTNPVTYRRDGIKGGYCSAHRP